MKKNIILAILLIITLVAIFFISKRKLNLDEVYTSKDYEFSIKAPKYWTIETGKTPEEFGFNANFITLKPNENDINNGYVPIQISILDNPKNLSIRDWLAASPNNYKNNLDNLKNIKKTTAEEAASFLHNISDKQDIYSYYIKNNEIILKIELMDVPKTTKNANSAIKSIAGEISFN